MPVSTPQRDDNHEFRFRRLDYDPFSASSSPPHLTPPLAARPSPIPMPPSAKPNSRLLSFLLQASVMALAISLFFLFVAIAALVLVHICIAGRALRRRRRRSASHHLRAGPESLFFPSMAPGLSQKDLQQLPAFDFAADDSASVDPTDCPVCLEAFGDGERCRILPRCSHVFHAQCVDRWLSRAPACPVCRSGVSEERKAVDDSDGGSGAAAA